MSMCCESFLWRLKDMAGEVFSRSSAMAVWNLVRMCVRLNSAGAFSLDTT